MHVVSLAPIPVSSVTWQHRAGPWTTTVICKLTFRLEPGEAQVAKRHEPLHDRDVMPDEGASVYAPADLVPGRERVDVTLVGSACAPGGVPVTSLRARLVVGAVDKAIQIDAVGSGERTGAFKSASLGYEHADASPDNPVGGRREHHRIAVVRGKGRVAGFGPLAAVWPARHRFLGGAPAPELAEGGGPYALDEAIDRRFFNAAPPDQQLAELPPNAELLLENLHPDHPRLRTRLPNVAAQVFVERPGARRTATEAPIRALWIDTRRSVATVTFVAPIPLERPDEPGRIWVAVAGPGRRLSPAGLDGLIGSLGAGADEEGPDDEPTADETGKDLLRRTQAVPTREGTRTSLLSKEHLMERTAYPSGDVDAGMPSWMKPSVERGPAARAPAPSRPPPPRRSAPSVVPPMRPPAPTQAGLGPGWEEPRPDRLADTSSLPQIEAAPLPAPAPSFVRPPTPSLDAPPARSPESPVVVKPAAPPAPRPTIEVVELLWYDEEATALLRKRFRALTEELDFAPRDDQHDLPDADPKRARDHHTHFGVLAQAPTSDHAMLRRSLREAVSETGRFTPPLLALRGTLRPAFDEVEVLRVTAAVARPIAGDDKKLKATLDQIDELDESPVLRGSLETVKRFTDQLRRQYREGRRALSAEYLEETVERVLLEERRYARRKLFGGEVIRATFHLRGESRAFTCYLLEGAAERLPMLAELPARIVAEVHFKQDQYDPSPHALRVVTLGRVIEVGD